MKVIENIKSNYWEDPIRFFEFEKFEDKIKDCLLFIGAQPHEDIFKHANVPKYFLSLEEQWTEFDTTYKFVDHVEKIFTICPIAAQQRPKREYVYFPFNFKYAPVSDIDNKPYDVIYIGEHMPPHVTNIIKTIVNFNYRFASFTPKFGVTTDVGVTYSEKLNLISKSKATVVHNLVFEGNPQLKSRPFEAAASKSLIVCKKDNFGTLEKWFEPGLDFIYYEKDEDLNDVLREVVNNFKNYKHIIENAYIKVQNYTPENFLKTYIGVK